MDPLLKGQLRPEGSRTVSRSVVSDGDLEDNSGACSSLLVTSPSPLPCPSSLPGDSSSPGSFLPLLSLSLVYGLYVVHVFLNSLFDADAVVVALATTVALVAAVVEAIAIPAAGAAGSTAVAAVLVAPVGDTVIEIPSAVAAIAVAAMAAFVSAAADPY